MLISGEPMVARTAAAAAMLGHGDRAVNVG